MLPSFLVNTYKRYKQDTDAFTIWLENTARDCGYTGSAGPEYGDRDPHSGKRPYRISLSSFVRLAKVIANHDPKVAVPGFIATMGLRIVSLRQKCARWYATQTGEAVAIKSMIEHAHFIEVFQTVLEILGVEDSSAQASAPPEAPSTKQKQKKLNVRNRVDHALNRFSALELQLPSPDAAAHSVSTGKALLSYRTTHVADTTDVEVTDDYDVWTREIDGEDADARVPDELSDLSDKDEDELNYLNFFRMYCLLEDVKSIRNFIQQLWRDFKSSKVDLMTAAVTTNTAIAFVRQQCEDESLKGLSLDDVRDTLDDFYDAVCELKGLTSDDYEDVPLNDETQRVSEWCCLDTFIKLKHLLEDLKGHERMFKVKRNRFGVFDPHDDRSAMDIAEGLLEDRVLISESIRDFAFMAQFGIPMPAEDEYTAGIRHMFLTGKIPFWFCFAARIYLDIMHSLRTEHEVPYKQLRNASERIHKTLTNYFDFAEYMSNPLWSDRDEGKLGKILEDIDRYVLGKDPYCVLDMLDDTSAQSMRVQEILDETAAKKRSKGSKGSNNNGNSGDYRFLKQHGLLAGTILFNFNFRMHEAGTQLSSVWGSVIYPAFLYNEIQHQGHAVLSWPDMDQVITFHGEHNIFAGPKPEDIETTSERSKIMRGYSRDPNEWGPWHRKPSATAPMSEKGPQGLTESTVISALLRDRFVEGKPMAVSQQSVERLLRDLASKEEAVRSDASSALQKKWTASQKLSTIELLALLRERLMDEERKLVFNYFGMHQRGIELLRLIKDANGAKLAQYLGPEYLEQEEQLSFICNWLFVIAAGGQKNARQSGFGQADGQKIGSAMMLKTGELMAKWLQKNGQVAVKELKAQVINKHLLDPITAAQNKASGFLDSGYLVPLREILGFEQDEMDKLTEMTRKQLTTAAGMK